MSQQDPIVITAAKRTAMGNYGGQFKQVSTTQLGANAIAALQANSLPVDQVVMGCVLSAGLGQAPARQAALAAGLPVNVPCTTVNKMCGSGMQAVFNGINALHNGAQFVVAGGMENMSRAPYLAAQARFGYRIGDGELIDHMMHDGLQDAYEGHHVMGHFAELCAQKYQLTREQQDQFAIASLERAQLAAKEGWFTDEIADSTVDEGPTLFKAERIPTLKPAFAEDGTVTAANTSSISDGAAALLLMREKTALQNKLPILGKVIGTSTFAQQPDWFTTAPVGAIQQLLKTISWDISEVDLFEINEAFAVVPLAAMHELNIPHDKVNINGGACVLGHPIGASGARIIVTLLHALKQRDLKRGIAAICIAGGEATAIAIER